MTDPAANDANGPFEGPEKLLEIWFALSPGHVPDATSPDENGRTGLRKVPRHTWEAMLSIVRCKVLSVVNGDDTDAYLLSESSLFISPHRLILKTCGTTLNLLGLPRILEIAASEAGMPSVYRLFYSRKSFMFPDRQEGPHRDWKYEVEYLDNIFPNGAAYTVGKVNGDHWLLYLTNPEDEKNGVDSPGSPESPVANVAGPDRDFTIEILMSDLAQEARQQFFSTEEEADPSAHALSLSSSIGVSEIFPPAATTLDAYSFSPCGYSANALVRGDIEQINGARGAHSFREGYYTIHVTPEEGWSYASFECNIPVHHTGSNPGDLPDLKTLIRRVVDIFQPGHVSLTMFLSNSDDFYADFYHVEHAQNAFKAALVECGGEEGPTKRAYKRSDKINYEFRGYDLAFASFTAVKGSRC